MAARFIPTVERESIDLVYVNALLLQLVSYRFLQRYQRRR